LTESCEYAILDAGKGWKKEEAKAKTIKVKTRGVIEGEKR